MATRVELVRAVRLDGKRYAPGEEAALLEVVSSDEREDLTRRGLLRPVAERGVALSGDDAGRDGSEVERLRAENQTLRARVAELEAQLETGDGDETGTDESNVLGVDALGVAIESKPAARLLIEAGFDTLEKLRGATDNELLDLNGVGPKAVEKLREWLG